MLLCALNEKSKIEPYIVPSLRCLARFLLIKMWKTIKLKSLQTSLFHKSTQVWFRNGKDLTNSTPLHAPHHTTPLQSTYQARENQFSYTISDLCLVLHSIYPNIYITHSALLCLPSAPHIGSLSYHDTDASPPHSIQPPIPFIR